MKCTFAHNNLNVLNLEKSLAFYEKALGLHVVRKKETPDFTLCFLSDGTTPHMLELTWLRGREKPYDLGENEFHLAFAVSDMAEVHALHEAMGCICFENPGMGIYFIADPDGYWLEIVPAE
ncbi:MAG: VOC family protein [Ruthenibacterium sp.]|nr:VOC family protein [Ruthenibacterium sp.]